MTLLIILFGGFILAAGVLLLKNPETIFGYLQSNAEKLIIHVFAAVVRLLIGVVLIIQAGASRFPLGIEVLGWIFVTAGFILAVIGRKKFRRLMSWVLNNFKPYGRFAGVVSILFGGFLVYAFL